MLKHTRGKSCSVDRGSCSFGRLGEYGFLRFEPDEFSTSESNLTINQDRVNVCPVGRKNQRSNLPICHS